MRILLIEDNPGDAGLLRRQLAECQPRCDLAHVQTLSDGLARLAGQAFDVLLLDLNLPDSEGLATVKTISPAAADVAIVVLTGLEDGVVGIESVRQGAQDYLVKGQTTGPLLGRALAYALERKRLLRELQAALARVKTLRGLLPICSSCKRVRDDKGYWQAVEVYVKDHTEADFSHGICPECMHRLYPDIANEVLKQGK